MLYDKAKEMLVFEEGSRNRPYDDADGSLVRGKGNVTIGIGHNLDANPLSESSIDWIFNSDFGRTLIDSRFAFKRFDAYPENRQLAIINMVFNLGGTAIMHFQNLIKAADGNDWKKAADEVRSSKWASQVPKRAARVALMFESNSWPY